MDARSHYRESAVRGASPVRLVVCLYEQAIEDLRRAVAALERGDVEGRTRGINHALTVIAHLQGSLDMQQGGEVAANLNGFYGLIRAGLVQAHVKESARILEEQISLLVTIHEAWLEVERITPAPAPQFRASGQTAPIFSEPQTPIADWNA